MHNVCSPLPPGTSKDTSLKWAKLSIVYQMDTRRNSASAQVARTLQTWLGDCLGTIAAVRSHRRDYLMPGLSSLSLLRTPRACRFRNCDRAARPSGDGESIGI